MTILGVQTVGVAVRDVRLIARFFYEKFGCDIQYSLDHIQASAIVSIGNNNLILYQVLKNNEALVSRHVDVSKNPPGFDHVAISCEDLHQTYQDLKSKGVVFSGIPQFYPQWGFHLVAFLDPEGNSYYLLEVLD